MKLAEKYIYSKFNCIINESIIKLSKTEIAKILRYSKQR